MLAAEGIGFRQGFLLLIIWIPLVTIWVFVLIDLFQRTDMSGWLKALWVVVIILIPFFGALVYLIFRPFGMQYEENEKGYERMKESSQASNAADKLYKLSILRDKGDLSQEEFEKQKARLLGD
ncbi:MAG: SHOCT domain-containing protein [Actinomycetota bacterium]|nr:SHOCT domain-containing protein [Actinomycetota bacterium]